LHYVGVVEGNEEADYLAKQNMGNQDIEIKIKYSRSEIKSIIKKQIPYKWQMIWDNEIKCRHLYFTQPQTRRLRNFKEGKGKKKVLLPDSA